MEPVYSRDECIIAIRDYYAFVTKMFANPSSIVEPPQGGWPDITQETMRGLGKTEKVIELLRHLPYIESKPYSNHAAGFPGASFIDWTRVARELQTGEAHPENELLMSEGYEDRFERKIPAYFIGLVHGGYMLNNEEPDVILLDTKSGDIYWMDCPQCVRESALPKPPYRFYVTEERGQVDGKEEEQSNEANQDNEGKKDNEGNEEIEEYEEEEEQDEEEYSDDDEDDIRWGPYWPVRDFFEMLKNQYLQLNFLAKDRYDVVDIWTTPSNMGESIPDSYIKHLQAIYRKHGWPDLSKY